MTMKEKYPSVFGISADSTTITQTKKYDRTVEQMYETLDLIVQQPGFFLIEDRDILRYNQRPNERELSRNRYCNLRQSHTNGIIQLQRLGCIYVGNDNRTYTTLLGIAKLGKYKESHKEIRRNTKVPLFV